MSKNRPTEEELQRFNRWFGVTANNRAWELIEKPDRTPEDDQEMLLAAYASAYHWQSIGKPVNHNRGLTLLAQVHALLGQGELALRHGLRAFEFVMNPANESEDWEIALAHAVMAGAYHANGDAAEHSRFYHEAAQLIADIADEEDRVIIEGTFASVPKPD